MANTTLSGLCPAPFLDNSKFPSSGGSIAGRLCAPLDEISPGLTCCLPCPSTDYIYPRSFKTWYKVAESLNALGIAFSLFLLITWAVLPPEKTRRHYLSVCLIIAVVIEGLGFVVPLGVQPDQCYNEITPNDMYSNLTCAWSGALVISGGLAITVWIFIRALSMHLQICWDIVPGQKFFYSAQAGGWGIVALLFALTTVFTGFAFRFGDACHVNAANSVAVFWGPLLGIAGASGLVQLSTFAYCINVYLKNIWSDEKSETNGSSGLPSYTSSLNTHSAKAVYRRVRKVVWLQWRSMLVVVFILADVIFFSVVFVWMDNTIEQVSEQHNLTKVMPWLLCLIQNGKATEHCLELGQKAIVNQSTVIAILILLALAGTQTFILQVRWTMFTGWYDYLRNKLAPRREFVSLDAKRYSGDQRSYELLNVGAPDHLTKSSEVSMLSPSPSDIALSPYDRKTPDHFAKETSTSHNNYNSPTLSHEFTSPTISREYTSPVMSFSGPRTPSQAYMESRNRGWDATRTFARGGLGMNPPDEEEGDVMKNRI